MKKSILLSLLLISVLALIAVSIFSCSNSEQPSAIPISNNILIETTAPTTPVPKSYPETLPNLILYPISSLDFNADEIVNIVNTEGQVIYQQQNPDCPNGAQSKACRPSYIIVSENNLPVRDVARLSNQQMVIWVDNPLQFSRLTNYRFTIMDLQKTVGEWPYFEAKLLAYSHSDVARKIDSISDKDEEIIESIFALDTSELSCNEPLIASLIEQYKDNMLACQTNNDCIAMMPTCGTQNQLSTVNRVFAPLHEYLQSAASACFDCVPPTRELTNIRCENNQCKADFVAK